MPKLSCAALIRLACTLCVALAACTPSLPTASPAPSLYSQLGGEPVIAQVVSHTIDQAARDPRTRRSFEGIKLAAVKTSLAQQICALAEGPCRYEGETMVRAHREARITASEFDAMVGMLRRQLDAAGVDDAAKNRLLRLLAPMKRDIVTDGAASSPARGG
ncbi:MAG: group 1 truncated hemoglobin [Rubrivivax sp.]